MLRLPIGARVLASTTPVHARAGTDRLVQVVRDVLREDPFSGDLFCFFNGKRDQVKILAWDRNGFWLLAKRLERGTFEKITLHEPSVELDLLHTMMLLEGIDTRTRRFRKHFGGDMRTRNRAGDHRPGTA